MNGFVFVFELICVNGSRYPVRIPAYSKQVAWAAIGGYVAAHTLNPAVEGIRLVETWKVADKVTRPDSECDHAYAIAALCCCE